DGRDILVNQVGCFGVRLGRIDFYFDSERIVTDGVSITV
ncbi:MAG: 5'-nucleotidase, partial [Maribacter sp.]